MITDSPTHLASKQIILIPQILPAIRLPEAHHARGIQPPRLGRAAGRHTEAEWDVVHAKHDDARVLGAVLGPAADVGFDDCAFSLDIAILQGGDEGGVRTVGSVEEGLRAVFFDPHLVAGVFGEDGDCEGGGVSLEIDGDGGQGIAVRTRGDV